MQIVNIHEAKTHLSELIAEASQGKFFMISKNGKPMVKVIPVGSFGKYKPKRLGFMTGQIEIPDDFDEMGKNEMVKLFGEV